ncbi:YadA-like family protein [Brucella intermedia]|uniref:YadA-like family protein n=1 Tax=Brucella intermedia TaxID=94625 RepID=UPI00187ABA22|nr:YadA-like family protein [Brucella intermedia]
MAILRNAFKVLGVKRRGIGLGCLSASGAALAVSVVFSFGMPSAAMAATCIQNNEIGNGSASGGSSTPATCGPFSIAIGAGSGATASDFGIAIGDAATSTGVNSVALGRQSVATGENSSAVGRAANASAQNSSAIGNGTVANATGATALGYSADATGANSTALGINAAASGFGSFAGGSGATASGQNSIAIGSSSVAGDGAIALGLNSAATGSDAIAAGVGAAASGAGSLALGLNADASTANSVALGANSATADAVATASGTINGTSYNFAGAAPAGTISIGAVGTERTLTNLAAGRLDATSTDGVNGSQLFATNQAVDTIGTNLDGLGASTATALGGGATFNPIDGTVTTPSFTIQGTNAGSVGEAFSAVDGNLTSINTAMAEINAGSGIMYFRANSGLPDSQANGANSVAIGPNSIAAGANSFAAGNGANAGGQDAIAIGRGTQTTHGAVAVGLNASATGNDTFAFGTGSSASGASSLAFGLNAHAATANSVALGAGSVTADVVATADGAINGTTYSFAGVAPTGTVSIGAAGSERTLTNLAAGRLDATSTDAVNGSQLFATNQAVDLLGTGLGNLGSSVAAGLGGATVYDPATNSIITGLDVGGTSYTNVQEALTAVNATAGAGFFVQANGDSSTNIAPGGTVQFLNGKNIEVSREDGNITVATSADLEVDSLTLASGQVFDASGLSMNGSGITGLSAGAIAAGSTDGVNGGQIYGVSQSVADIFGGGAIVNPDGTIGAPTYVIQGGSYNNVGDAFGAVNNNLTDLNNSIGDINNGNGIKYFRANSTLEDAQAVGSDSVSVGPASIAAGNGSVAMGNGASAGGNTSIALGNASAADGAASVAIGDGATASEANSVALGAGSTTEAVVATTGTTIRGQEYTFAGGAPVGTVSVGSEGGERTVTNVAAGRISADSTDAVNGSQLNATNQALENVEAGVGDLQEFAVQYDRKADGSKANSVTLQGGDPNAPVVLANVAAGTRTNDAVNVGQLKDGLQDNLDQSYSYTDTKTAWAVETSNNYTDKVAQTTLQQANDYTDQRLSQLNTDIGDVRKEARQAAAIGLAAASLRYDDRPGKLSVAAGGGLWRSSGALAFGAGYTSESQRFRSNVSATTAGGHWGVGAGLSFTLN